MCAAKNTPAKIYLSETEIYLSETEIYLSETGNNSRRSRN